MKTYFHAYAGAVAVTRGVDHLMAWIGQLLGLSASPSNGLPTNPVIKSENFDSVSPSSSFSDHGGTIKSEKNHVSLLNELAQVKHWVINYTSSSTGPSHSPTWMMICKSALSQNHSRKDTQVISQ